ncbi:hypothetical protein BN7_3127 [Wickerhamomyces ciferrii]|uniref:Processing of GAS1 and ALP protein 2 n=1 Tax=Wickerhamomyces ciferrii (strain ATCC 14091 / BCRC 22168 / CBS 111 / JCM 3599 / NBRC 0793 / NRRL Y-1031 F-60-10) TaxID=1206466 RepID=K0KQ75_WICCF|nr:uncharacterized protein BN7_3127 [Wickerhamomyces ciferrii]CCH43574.1 hypothetical protein BN7_3127 [Wickerhamomyces ciferrii]
MSEAAPIQAQYHKYIEAIIPYIPATLREIDIHKAIRLVVIIGGYIFIRNIAQKVLANRQLKQQLAQDEKDRDQERIRELVEDPKAKTTATESGFGWGKKTRRNIKLQEEILKETLEKLEHQDDDSDKDIEDLLEDE